MKKLKEKGFSLIEAVLYLAIVSIVLTAVVNFHLTLGGTSSKLGANIDTSRNRRTALSKIDYLIKNSDGFLKDHNGDCSNFSSSPNTLALYFDDDTYLPGECVSNGGGVRITIDSNRVKIICQPNIDYNGEYNSCNTIASNTYYLTSPDIEVNNNGLNFSTSTATSTSSSFTSLTTNIITTSISGDQVQLRSTSTATSTVNLRNEQLNGLVAWYKFDDASGSSAIDSSGDNDLTCYGPTPVSGIISDGAFDFESSDGDYCEDGNDDSLNFDNGFSLTAWFSLESTATDTISPIINKNDGNKGYVLMVKDNSGTKTIICAFCDDTECDESVESSAISYRREFHIACLFDPIHDEVKLLIKEKDGVSYSVHSSLSVPYSLVNSSTNLQIASTTYSHGTYFDGIIDDIRMYNRVLTTSEVNAIQSQEDYD